uniref:Uncharacterized protein n=1 Tax=Rhizophagus irregularis (strain DAOM 181602 / DAOM 197198 / MUCL 43194) TaxID=747089 RepID=U9TJ16_RHIID
MEREFLFLDISLLETKSRMVSTCFLNLELSFFRAYFRVFKHRWVVFILEIISLNETTAGSDFEEQNHSKNPVKFRFRTPEAEKKAKEEADGKKAEAVLWLWNFGFGKFRSRRNLF